MPMPLPSRSNSTTRLELGASTGTPRHCSVHQQPATQIRQALKNVFHFLTRDNEPTIGSCRTRTDRPVTVTSAPLFNTSAFFAQTPCKSTARGGCAGTLLPNSDRGWTARAAGSQQRVEIGIERDTYTRLSSRALGNVCVVGTTHADFRHMYHVPPGLPQQIESPAAHLDQAGCDSRRFEWLHALGGEDLIRRVSRPGPRP